MGCNIIKENIQISPCFEHVELKEKDRFVLESSKWYPGYCSHLIIYRSDNLKIPKIQKAVKEKIPDFFNKLESSTIQ